MRNNGRRIVFCGCGGFWRRGPGKHLYVHRNHHFRPVRYHRYHLGCDQSVPTDMTSPSHIICTPKKEMQSPYDARAVPWTRLKIFGTIDNTEIYLETMDHTWRFMGVSKNCGIDGRSVQPGPNSMTASATLQILPV